MDKEVLKLMREAIKSGELKRVKELLTSYDGLLDEDTLFGSWLHVAADFGRIDIAEYLIYCGIDLNRNGGISGGNPVRSAARHGHVEIIELLYKNGARLDVSEANRNPLFGAICNGHFDVVRFLVEKGIDISAQYDMGTLNNVDAYEYARQYGQTEIADYLKGKLEERNN